MSGFCSSSSRVACSSWRAFIHVDEFIHLGCAILVACPHWLACFHDWPVESPIWPSATPSLGFTVLGSLSWHYEPYGIRNILHGNSLVHVHNMKILDSIIMTGIRASDIWHLTSPGNPMVAILRPHSSRHNDGSLHKFNVIIWQYIVSVPSISFGLYCE